MNCEHPYLYPNGDCTKCGQWVGLTAYDRSHHKVVQYEEFTQADAAEILEGPNEEEESGKP
jgi:hypothetical protein